MITLHSLDQSRALRIVWLLEILGTPYRLQTYRHFAGARRTQSHPSLGQIAFIG